MRWDDVSHLQDHDKVRALADVFLKYNKPVTLGVIPKNRDADISLGRKTQDEFYDDLREYERAGWEIAMHGYRHLKHTKSGGILNLHRASEFAERPYEDQLSDLQNGRKIIMDRGFNPITFVPPWHSFDNNTLRAMEVSGFKILSDGYFLYPRMTGSLLQLPMILWSIPNRMKALHRIGSVYTICFHPQLTTKDDLDALERFFRNEQPHVVTAASLLDRAEELTRNSMKKMLLNRLFTRFYKRQGNPVS